MYAWGFIAINWIVHGSEFGTYLTSSVLVPECTVDGSNIPVVEFTAYVEAVKEEKLVAEYEVGDQP